MCLLPIRLSIPRSVLRGFLHDLLGLVVGQRQGLHRGHAHGAGLTIHPAQLLIPGGTGLDVVLGEGGVERAGASEAGAAGRLES